ncbi:MAG: amidohydrolase [Ardenticatenaceae bacterium]|nr:amidohydrolase [Ardenticatenaceae bacterium]
MSSRTYLRGGLVLPLDERHDWFDPGVVTFAGGRITYVGPMETAPSPVGDTIVHDCSDRVILPGLVNTHTHTGMSYFRNLLEDLPSPEWFQHELEAERHLTPDDIYWAALLGAYELLRMGVTTTADRFSHMRSIVPALEHAGLRAIVAPSLVDSNAEARQRESLSLLEQYGARGDGLIRVGLGPVGPDTCSTGLLRWTRAQADRYGALIFIHLAQSRQELREVARRGYHGAARYLDAIGVLGPDVVAAHCIYLDPEEVTLLGARGVRVAHCPASNAKIEGRVAPVMALERAGARVGLGTDCAASNNSMDLFSEMKTAGLLHKVALGDPSAMPVPKLLALATRRAADCLDVGDEVGSLEVGKRADVITVRRNEPFLQPWHDPRAGLVYATRGLDVQEVWVDGHQRVAAGRLLADDVAEAVARAAAWGARFARSRHNRPSAVG